MTIAVDFDGVIHAYSRGWQDGSIYDDPVPGAFSAIHALQSRGIPVVVFTSRTPVAAVADWIQTWSALPCTADINGDANLFWTDTSVILVTNRKPAAAAYIDDRAIRFTSWPQALADLAAITETAR